MRGSKEGPSVGDSRMHTHAHLHPYTRTHKHRVTSFIDGPLRLLVHCRRLYKREEEREGRLEKGSGTERGWTTVERFCLHTHTHN